MDLQMAAIDGTRFREFMYSLVQRFSRQGVSLFSTYETHNLHSGRARGRGTVLILPGHTRGSRLRGR